MTRKLLSGTAAAVVALCLLAPTAALAKKFVYVHDRDNPGGIWGYTMDKQGGLTSLPGSPFALIDPSINVCGGHCQTMAYSTKRKTLYTGGQTGVSGYTVNKDGTLTPVAVSPFIPSASGEFLGTGVVQIGKNVFVYSASFAADGLFAFIANKDGTLTEMVGSPFATGDGPVGIAAVKKNIFVANFTDLTVSSFLANKDGTLLSAPGSPVTPTLVSFIYNVSPDPKGKFLYVVDDAGAVHGFAVDKKTAGLTELTGSPFPTVSASPKTGAVVTKKLLWSVEFETQDDAMQPFSIAKDGTLANTGIVINTPLAIDTHTSDPKGKRIVLAGPTSIASATIEDKSDGSLTGLGSANFPLAINPNAVLVVKR